MKDLDIVAALVNQVRFAVPQGGTERDVVTIITRPMWQGFLRGINESADAEPTDWLGHETFRVNGSLTIVIEREESYAVSLARSAFAKM